MTKLNRIAAALAVIGYGVGSAAFAQTTSTSGTSAPYASSTSAQSVPAGSEPSTLSAPSSPLPPSETSGSMNAAGTAAADPSTSSVTTTTTQTTTGSYDSADHYRDNGSAARGDRYNSGSAAYNGAGESWTHDYSSSMYIMPSLNAARPDHKWTDHNGEGAGLRIGGAVSPNIDLQFGPTYMRAKNGGTRYQQNTVGLDALYMLSRETFRPFVLLGLGGEFDKESQPGFSQHSRTSPYVNGGIGFQYMFTDQWGMQADVRRVYGLLKRKDFGFNRSNNNYLTVGLTYYFDKPVHHTVAQTTTTSTTVAAAPAPAPVAPPPPPPAPARFERQTLSATELFDFNSATLRQPQTKLDQIADALNQNTSINDIQISGYSDRLGSDRYNLKLSQRRADAVRNYLMNKGIAANRLTAVGKGKANPVVECHDKRRSDLIKCLEPNRRVEVEQIVIERRVQ